MTLLTVTRRSHLVSGGTLGRLVSRTMIVGGAVWLVTVVVAAVFAPLIATHEPDAADFGSSLTPPSGDHWLGADRLGRDTYSRLVFGARVALLAATQATVVALLIGVPLGLLIGYRAGWLDRISMRLIDGLSAIPGVVLAIALIAALGTGLTRSMLAVGLVFAMIVARLTRGQVLAERERLYVDGARVVGAAERAILFRHVLPNVAPVLVVQATLIFSSAIAIEAGLSFLGLGVQPPDASWGIMLSDAQESLALDAFQVVPPGVAIFLTVLAVNSIGDVIQSIVIGGRAAAGGNVLSPAPMTASGGDSTLDFGERTVLAVDGLTVAYRNADGSYLQAVSGAGIRVDRGEVLAVVGESGCGKSSLGLAIAGLLSPPAVVTVHSAELHASSGVIDTASGESAQRERWRRHVGVVFQEPAASLNPVHTVGRHLTRVLRLMGLDARDARARALELLTQVQIADPESVLTKYPHEISGGMAQRVMIALALAQEPEVLIADEPTTALDVTVQAEILQILRALCEEFDLAVVLITHDLGVVADLATRAVVMYAGQVVEEGTVAEIVSSPLHPYTAALASAVPRNEAGGGIPETLAGSVPDPGSWPTGCRFAPRCEHSISQCIGAPVQLRREGRRAVACIRSAELELAGIPGEVES
jgi:peptide/nickel transport system permease protein